MAKKTDTVQHILVPKHSKVSEKERKELLEKYNIDPKQLPKIQKSDPAIAPLGVKIGDIIKIERSSHTAGTALFYREVSNV